MANWRAGQPRPHRSRLRSRTPYQSYRVPSVFDDTAEGTETGIALGMVLRFDGADCYRHARRALEWLVLLAIVAPLIQVLPFALGHFPRRALANSARRVGIPCGW
jgi:hypothetical protein